MDQLDRPQAGSQKMWVKTNTYVELNSVLSNHELQSHVSRTDRTKRAMIRRGLCDSVDSKFISLVSCRALGGYKLSASASELFHEH